MAYYDKYESIEEDTANFYTVLSSLPLLSQEEVESLTTRFKKTLSFGDVYYFGRKLGEGVFKLCEELDIEKNYVIKFCANTADNEGEVSHANYFFNTLDQRIFLPAYYLHLSFDYFPDFFGEEEDSPHISDIIIQPRISLTCSEYNEDKDLPESSTSIWHYHPNDVIPFSPSIPRKSFDEAGISDTIWLEAVAKTYGEDFLRELLQFITDEEIGDLHRQNLGYRYEGQEKIPVIIDFFY